MAFVCLDCRIFNVYFNIWSTSQSTSNESSERYVNFVGVEVNIVLLSLSTPTGKRCERKHMYMYVYSMNNYIAALTALLVRAKALNVITNKAANFAMRPGFDELVKI